MVNNKLDNQEKTPVPSNLPEHDNHADGETKEKQTGIEEENTDSKKEQNPERKEDEKDGKREE